jgi:hypothetical protein
VHPSLDDPVVAAAPVATATRSDRAREEARATSAPRAEYVREVVMARTVEGAPNRPITRGQQVANRALERTLSALESAAAMLYSTWPDDLRSP